MLVALAGISYVLALICGLASLVFFVMVVIQMFKRDESTMGIICIVLTFCTGLGPIIAFVYGWTKAKEWEIGNIMKYWSITFALQIVFVIVAVIGAAGAAATIDPNQFEMDPGAMEFDIDMGDGTTFEMPEPDGANP